LILDDFWLSAGDSWMTWTNRKTLQRRTSSAV